VLLVINMIKNILNRLLVSSTNHDKSHTVRSSLTNDG
jgi:hypothetical protein